MNEKTKNYTKHGLSETREYKIWKHMKVRCYNKNASNYKDYGEIGIKIWDGWLHKPKDFIQYVRNLPRYNERPDMSIDRIDPYGNYEPGNIRWATPTEQAQNRRTK